MEYKKIEKGTYNIHLINMDRFKTVCLEIAFTRKYNEKEAIYLNLLSKVLTSSTKKYKTSMDMLVATEELYGAELASTSSILGNLENMKISLEFLNPIYTEKSMINECLNLLCECVFNPNIDKHGFDKKYFEINKANIINEINNINDNATPYSFLKFRELMYKNTPASFNLFNKLEEFEAISPKELYEFYQQLIETSKIDIFVLGNIKCSEEYVSSIDNALKNKKNTFNNKLQLPVLEKKNKLIIKKEKRNFIQSCLHVGYQLLNPTEYERKYLLHFYSIILGNMNNSVLFKKVREENSLCYTVDSYINRYPASLVIETEINRKSYNKTITLIEECMKDMNNIKLIQELFDTAKNSINTSLNSFYDDKAQILDYYYFKEFDNIDDIEQRRKKFMDIKINDIVSLNKKFNKSVIYFLEGVNDEENNI